MSSLLFKFLVISAAAAEINEQKKSGLQADLTPNDLSDFMY